MPSLTPDLLKILVPDFAGWPVFIETGTYHGETIKAMEPLFGELHTIELCEQLWSKCKSVYSEDKICFHQGDSASVLREILPRIRKPATIYLDGHWSCGDTARGEIDVPLLHELAAIRDCFQPPAVIIIDDLRLFETGPRQGEQVDWTGISTKLIRKVLESRCFSWREHLAHDKLIIRMSRATNSVLDYQ